MTSLTKFFKSFYFAFRGITAGFKERNMKVHGVAALSVIVAGVIWQISPIDWMILFLLIGLVWAAELINTSLEELADLVRDENKLSYHATKNARDLAAGAVLTLAIISAIIGIFIFVLRV